MNSQPRSRRLINTILRRKIEVTVVPKTEPFDNINSAVIFSSVNKAVRVLYWLAYAADDDS